MRTKVGIVGVGAVGAACAMAMVARGTARDIVLIDKNRPRAAGTAADLGYAAPVSPINSIRDGDYADLEGAGVVLITAGVNEKAGGATDRADPAGRLRLLDANAQVYRDVVPNVAAAAPGAVLVVVTDPPDPLADLTRRLAGHGRVVSAGTFLDSLRFRVHLGRHLGVHPASVDAQVIGEHGTTEVFLWSSASVAGVLVLDALGGRGTSADEVRVAVEREVRYANITIIEGTGASQYGIGVVCARITEMIVRDERAVVPVGALDVQRGVTFSLPSVVGASGVERRLVPAMNAQERDGLERSIDALRNAGQRVGLGT